MDKRIYELFTYLKEKKVRFKYNYDGVQPISSKCFGYVIVKVLDDEDLNGSIGSVECDDANWWHTVNKEYRLVNVLNNKSSKTIYVERGSVFDNTSIVFRYRNHSESQLEVAIPIEFDNIGVIEDIVVCDENIYLLPCAYDPSIVSMLSKVTTNISISDSFESRVNITIRNKHKFSLLRDNISNIDIIGETADSITFEVPLLGLSMSDIANIKEVSNSEVVGIRVFMSTYAHAEVRSVLFSIFTG